MSDRSDPLPRRTRRRNAYRDPPNVVPCGRAVEPPAGITAWPGPRRLIKHRRYVHVRIHPVGLSLFTSALWVADVLAELPDCGIVATGPDVATLKLYLMDRFQRVWFTVYDQAGHVIEAE